LIRWLQAILISVINPAKGVPKSIGETGKEFADCLIRLEEQIQF
jgi:hypothetical protein